MFRRTRKAVVATLGAAVLLTGFGGTTAAASPGAALGSAAFYGDGAFASGLTTVASTSSLYLRLTATGSFAVGTGAGAGTLACYVSGNVGGTLVAASGAVAVHCSGSNVAIHVPSATYSHTGSNLALLGAATVSGSQGSRLAQFILTGALVPTTGPNRPDGPALTTVFVAGSFEAVGFQVV
ncbi:MAG: hypothetical protein M3394_03840 [Actinomycetota bacterium]|nr:hypothetical protein [Actinomycetota bacterium]